MSKNTSNKRTSLTIKLKYTPILSTRRLYITFTMVFIHIVLMVRLLAWLMGMIHFLGGRCCSFIMLFIRIRKLVWFIVIFLRFWLTTRLVSDLVMRLIQPISMMVRWELTCLWLGPILWLSFRIFSRRSRDKIYPTKMVHSLTMPTTEPSSHPLFKCHFLGFNIYQKLHINTGMILVSMMVLRTGKGFLGWYCPNQLTKR